MKADLKQTKEELEFERQQSSVIQQNPQDKFIETLFDKGGAMFMSYLKTNAESEKYAIEKQTEYETQELKIVDNLDRRDKIFKGLLLVLSIFSLGLLAYFEKAQSIAPVIGVVIGLLLKTSSITEFFAGGKKKNNNADNEE